MNYRNLREIVWSQFDCRSGNYLENSELLYWIGNPDLLIAYFSRYLTMSEVAHSSFCLKFSALNYKWTYNARKIILKVRENSTNWFIIGLFLSLRKSTSQDRFNVYRLSLPHYLILLQRHNEFCVVIIFSKQQAVKNPSGQMWLNPPHDWSKTG